MTGILTVRGEVWNPACIDWTPVELTRVPVGAVQVAAEFTVTRVGSVLHGKADDYLFVDAAGEMIPIPREIALLLFAPVIPHQVGDRFT